MHPNNPQSFINEKEIFFFPCSGVEKGVHYIYILTETCVQQMTTYLYGGGLDVESDRSSTWVALHW